MARYALGNHCVIELRNIVARNDCGYAKNYAECMIKILRHKTSDDFVPGTGELHTAREFVTEAFGHVEINVLWRRSGIDEVSSSDHRHILVVINRK